MKNKTITAEQVKQWEELGYFLVKVEPFELPAWKMQDYKEGAL